MTESASDEQRCCQQDIECRLGATRLVAAMCTYVSCTDLCTNELHLIRDGSARCARCWAREPDIHVALSSVSKLKAQLIRVCPNCWDACGMSLVVTGLGYPCKRCVLPCTVACSQWPAWPDKRPVTEKAAHMHVRTSYDV